VSQCIARGSPGDDCWSTFLAGGHPPTFGYR
jgi:hypothetical protein